MNRFFALVLLLALAIVPHKTKASTNNEKSKAEKEWTFLLYLNGNNNLDSFGKLNINQMEAAGSSDAVNLVVQWASLANRDTRRPDFNASIA